jgi:hypothetical protein
MLVHGNIKAENFSVSKTAPTYLIDFDSFRLDVAVQDISDLIQYLLPAVDGSTQAVGENVAELAARLPTHQTEKTHTFSAERHGPFYFPKNSLSYTDACC